MEGTAQPGLTSTTWSALGDEVPVMLDDHDGRAVREQAVENSEQGLHVELKQTARIAEAAAAQDALLAQLSQAERCQLTQLLQRLVEHNTGWTQPPGGAAEAPRTPRAAGRLTPMNGPAWGSAELNLGAYLNRTGYRGPLEPTAATLRDLHRCQVQAIPFENLEISPPSP